MSEYKGLYRIHRCCPKCGSASWMFGITGVSVKESYNAKCLNCLKYFKLEGLDYHGKHESDGLFPWTEAHNDGYFGKHERRMAG